MTVQSSAAGLGFGMTMSQPAYCNNLIVASFVDKNIVSIKHPEKKATRLRLGAMAVTCSGRCFITLRFGTSGNTFSMARKSFGTSLIAFVL